MKKFITTMSTRNNNIDQLLYEAVDNKELSFNKKTAFPIIPAISSSVKKDDKIIIYTIIVDDKDSEEAVAKNNDLFRKELQDLSNEIGFTFEIEKIYKENAEDIDSLINLFSKLIDIPNNEDEISACLTYGTNPLIIVIMMALHYAYKVKESVYIKHIVYGKRLWNSNSKAEIYDLTPLFYINSAVESLAKLKLKEPESVLRAMLNQGE